MEAATFWQHVVSFNAGGPEDERGWIGLRRQMRAVVKRRFPTVQWWEWDEIEGYALEHAVRLFDPEKGAINTYLCIWAKKAAFEWMKRSSREISMSCLDRDEVFGLDSVAVSDVYSSGSVHLNNLLSIDIAVMAGHNHVMGYTVDDLLSDLCDGYTDMYIARKLCMSHKSVARAVERVKDRMRALGLDEELRERICVKARNELATPKGWLGSL